MRAHYIHSIDSDTLSTYRNQRGRLQLIARHALNAEGPASFAHWLTQNASCTHTVLANLPDESFHNDHVPHVSGADRKALLHRKLTQQFYGSHYATSLSLGREREGRRDERMLFTGFPRAAALDPWMQALLKSEAALKALYTPALLTHSLLRLMHPEASRGLIVSLSQAGIRQTYFDDSSLRFSRLSPAPEAPFSDWGDACFRETQKTLQYLNAQRWITRTTRLPVYLLLTRQDFAPLVASLERAEQLELHLVDLHSLAELIGLRETSESSDSLPLLLGLALREQHAPQLAPEIQRRVYRFRQARHLILWLSMFGMIGLSLAALNMHLDAQALKQHIARYNSDAHAEAQRLTELLSTLPQLPAPLSSLRKVLEVQTTLGTERISPHAAMRALSQSLDMFPDIELLQLEWEHSAPDLTDQTSKPRLSLQIRAALPAPDAEDPRAAIQRIQSFATDLRGRVAELRLLELPFDAESDKTLRSNAASQQKRPEFALKLSLQEPQP